MKTQIRRGVFETNSSSVHTLSIIKDSSITEYPEELEFLPGKFGWENELWCMTQEKAAYLWECIRSFCYNDDELKEQAEIINSITEILASHGVHAIFPYNHPVDKTYKNSEYHYWCYVDDEGVEDDGYVDHSSEAKDFVRDIAYDDNKLMNFLFDNNSWIIGGNDNQDDDDFLDEPVTGDSWIYVKGN